MLDPLEIPAPIIKQPLHFMQDPSGAPDWLKDTAAKVSSADGYVVVTAEYNATIPPGLTNIMDHFPPPSYRHKPVSIASYSMGKGLTLCGTIYK